MPELPQVRGVGVTRHTGRLEPVRVQSGARCLVEGTQRRAIRDEWEKVAAAVLVEDESLGRAAEDALARKLSGRGAVGIPMYTLHPHTGPNDESAAKAAAEQAGVVGIVVMRPVRVDKEISSTPSSFYYDGWGAYYGGEIHTDTIVTIETLVYSLAQNQLVWGGQSKTTNPANVGRVIEDTAKRVADELMRQGLL